MSKLYMYKSYRRSLLLSILVLSVIAINGDDIADDDDVIVLNEDNFDTIIQSRDLILVEFYAPWCGHCKALAPDYAKAATMLKSHDVPLAKVDATENRDLAQRFDVSGYPTLKIFRNGEPSEYGGPRDVDGIVKYMKRQVGPDAKPVESVSEINAYHHGEKDDKIHILGVFDKTKAYTPIRSSFIFIAKKLRTEFTFLIAYDKGILEKYGGEGIYALKKHDDDDDNRVKYSGHTATGDVEHWIRQHATPLVGEYKDKAVYESWRGDIAILYMVKNEPVKYIMNRLKPVAERYRDQLKVAYALASEHSDVLEELGQSKSNTHVYVITTSNGVRYVSSKPFSKKNLLEFTSEFYEGKAERFIKSETPPKTNDGHVKVITGRTFNDIVIDEHDVMIEFYAPWCGHCKALEPKYNDVGRKFRKRDNIVIGKIDATANDYPDDYIVSGYPTIYFKPAGEKPMKYDGDNESKDIITYIRKHKRTKKQKKKKVTM